MSKEASESAVGRARGPRHTRVLQHDEDEARRLSRSRRIVVTLRRLAGRGVERERKFFCPAQRHCAR